MERKHQLKPEDYPRKETFSRKFASRQSRFVMDIIIGDEATFIMDGRSFVYMITRQNRFLRFQQKVAQGVLLLSFFKYP